MRQILRFLILHLSIANALGATLIHNASELRDALRGDAQAAVLQDITLDRGCGPAGCVIDIADLRIQREQGLLQRIDGKPLHWQEEHGPLPELDWSPLAAYRVISAGENWGVCMEFSHSGIGKSGLNQRWSSLVLVPYNDNQPGPNAYRLVGNWTGCDSLQEGKVAGQLLLPMVSKNNADGEQPLKIRRYRCSLNACDSEFSPLPIRDENGTLLLAP